MTLPSGPQAEAEFLLLCSLSQLTLSWDSVSLILLSHLQIYFLTRITDNFTQNSTLLSHCQATATTGCCVPGDYFDQPILRISCIKLQNLCDLHTVPGVAAVLKIIHSKDLAIF